MLLTLTTRYFRSYQNFSRATWLNILAVFIMSFGLMMSSIFSLFLNQQHVTLSMISWIVAIGGGGGVLGSYLCGVVAKRVSATRIAQVALVGFTLTMLLFPWVHSITGFFILNFLSSFWSGVFRPANNIMLFTHAPVQEHSRVMALNRVAFNLGLACATTIGTWLAAIHFSLFFLFSAGMSLLSAIILFRYNKLLDVPLVKSVAAKESVTPIRRDFGIKYSFLLLCLLFFGYNMMFNQTRMAYVLFLENSYQLSIHQIGVLFMINFILILLVEVPLMTRFTLARQSFLAMWGSLLVGLGMFVLPFGHSPAFAALSFFLWSCGEILASSAFYVLSVRLVDEQVKSFYIGLFHSVFSAALVLSPLAGGALYPLHRGFILWGSCGILATVMVYGFRSLQRSNPDI
jgi:predicted MFS family arabinose efflux permease